MIFVHIYTARVMMKTGSPQGTQRFVPDLSATVEAIPTHKLRDVSLDVHVVAVDCVIETCIESRAIQSIELASLLLF